MVTSLLDGGPKPCLHGFRFLELGSATDSNLLPLAFYHPDATFLGIDASSVHVSRARGSAEALGLTNLRFQVGDVRALGADIGGPFELIVSHGVFSWVDAGARRGILECCRDRLTRDGLAYISYNVYPGWKLRGMVREALLTAARGVADPRERAEKAKTAASELRTWTQEGKSPYATLLAAELDLVLRSSPSYVLHEFLSVENQPFYLGEFVALAQEYGLDYVGDALSRFAELAVPEAIRHRVEAQGLAEVEALQIGDVLRNRQFRASLLCRAGLRGTRPTLSAVGELRAATSLVPPIGSAQLTPTVAEVFRGDDEAEVRVSSPLTKAALRLLGACWPGSLPFPEIVDRSGEALGLAGMAAPGPGDVERLQRDLLLIHRMGQGELRVREPNLAVHPGPRPTLTALALREVHAGSNLTSPLHRPVRLDALEHRIALGLDGTRDLDALAAEQVVSVAAKKPSLEIGGTAITDPLLLEPVVRGLVSRTITKLGQWALLRPEIP